MDADAAVVVIDPGGQVQLDRPDRGVAADAGAGGAIVALMAAEALRSGGMTGGRSAPAAPPRRSSEGAAASATTVDRARASRRARRSATRSIMALLTSVLPTIASFDQRGRCVSR